MLRVSLSDKPSQIFSSVSLPHFLQLVDMDTDLVVVPLFYFAIDVAQVVEGVGEEEVSEERGVA
jgi:hypothetical protein